MATKPQSTLAKKLQIPDGSRGVITDKPAELDLGLSSSGDGRDFAIVFVRNKADVDHTAGAAIAGLREDGLLWYCYPKKSSGVVTDISRDQGWEVLQGAGFRGVRQIAVDAVWSALRFRERRFVKA